jgi:lipoate-protein ligase A
MVWQSTPAVVVGKHQNALAEINYRFIHANNISVARRLTGGGTVYHDMGNINFTFIRAGETGHLVDFGAFIEPVSQFLNTLGIEAFRGKKNEILINGKKISGNAEHVYKNRVLHHGTLLYSSKLETLRESLKPAGGRYTGKAVQSNRSSVINLSDCMNPVLPIKDFREAMVGFIMNKFNGSFFKPDAGMGKAIGQLVREKYNTWEWVYGWSPDYTFENTFYTKAFEISIRLSTHRGIIQTCLLKSERIPVAILEQAINGLTGIPHEENGIRNTLSMSGFSSIIEGSGLEDLVFSFF